MYRSTIKAVTQHGRYSVVEDVSSSTMLCGACCATDPAAGPVAEAIG